MKWYKCFVNENIFDFLSKEKTIHDKRVKDIKNKKGDIIKLNIMDTHKYINGEIVISPYWNEYEDWIEVVVKYGDKTVFGYWSVTDKEWKLKNDI